MTTNLTLMHLMCAKICHDLAAPASAVAMGLEMLESSPQDPSTLSLVNFSAQSTISKLEVFRCLTGFAGLADKPTGSDLEKALKNYWSDSKVSVTWNVSDLNKIQGAHARLLLATLLTTADGLPRGGNITVGPNFTITADGPTARLREEAASALSGKTALPQQTSGTIVAYFAHTLAKGLGYKLSLETVSENQFQIQMLK